MRRQTNVICNDGFYVIHKGKTQTTYLAGSYRREWGADVRHGFTDQLRLAHQISGSILSGAMAYLGRRNIQHNVRYTELSPTPVQGFLARLGHAAMTKRKSEAERENDARTRAAMKERPGCNIQTGRPSHQQALRAPLYSIPRHRGQARGHDTW
jgi:hypothetical protein